MKKFVYYGTEEETVHFKSAAKVCKNVIFYSTHKLLEGWYACKYCPFFYFSQKMSSQK